MCVCVCYVMVVCLFSLQPDMISGQYLTEIFASEDKEFAKFVSLPPSFSIPPSLSLSLSLPTPSLPPALPPHSLSLSLSPSVVALQNRCILRQVWAVLN